MSVTQAQAIATETEQNPLDLEYFRRLLIKQREQALKDQSESREVASECDTSHYHTHMAENGTDSQEKEKNSFYAGRKTDLLKGIDEALARIENKTFGICGCGECIPLDRLKAVPHTKVCIKCKKSKGQ